MLVGSSDRPRQLLSGVTGEFDGRVTLGREHEVSHLQKHAGPLELH